MKNLLIIIILALLPTYFAAGQTKAIKKDKKHKHPVSKTLPANKQYYDDCRFTNKYSAAQRRKFYPFSKAAKVIGVSYGPSSNEPDTAVESNEVVHIDDLIKIGRFHYQSMMESIELSSQQIDSLTSILYNYTVKVPNNYDTPDHRCLKPRNTLFFVDEKGMIFDYLEISFECENTRSFSNKILTGNFCNQKYEILRKYLISLWFVTGPGRSRSN